MADILSKHLCSVMDAYDPISRQGAVFLRLAPQPDSRPHGTPDFLSDANRTPIRLVTVANGYPMAELLYGNGNHERIAALHSLQRAIRPYRPGRDGIFLSNTWGGGNGDLRINDEFLRKEVLAGAELGVDVVQIDDGWQHGKTVNSRRLRDGDEGAWNGYWAADPDFWKPDSSRFPEGLAPIVELAQGRGVRLGLWFGPDSSGDAANWERDADCLLGYYRRFGIAYFKIDSLKLHSKESFGRCRKMFDKMQTESKGEMVFDLDATAEVRPGYFGMMDIGPIFVENRYAGRNYRPWATLSSLWQLSHAIDPLRLRMEVVDPDPCRSTIDEKNLLAATHWPLDAGFAIAMFASPLGWMELSEMRPERRAAIKALVATWKRERGRLYSGVTFPVGMRPDGFSWTGFVNRSADGGGGYALLFREANEASKFSLPIGSWFKENLGQPEVIGGRGSASLSSDGSILTVDVPAKLDFVWVKFKTNKEKAYRNGRRELLLNEGWAGTMTPEGGEVRKLESIDLPHNWDDYHGYRHLYHGNQHGSAVYSRKIVLAKKEGERQFLVFEGAGSYLTVRVNGREVCTKRPASRLVVTVEATDALVDGENRLEVVCDHPSDIKDLPWVCGGCSGCTCESPEAFGLFRSVRLVTTGAARIAPFGVHLWHDGACRTAYVETEIDFGGADPRGLALRVVQKELGVDDVVSCAEAVDGRIRRSYPLKGVRRWSVEEPNLYTFEVSIVAGEKVVDNVSARTGYNTVRWPTDGGSDHRFFLNGRPVLVHGTAETDHRFGGSLALEPEEIDARCREFRKLGFNAFRDGHEPHDLAYMRGIEDLGLMWYAGFSTHVYFDTEEFRRNFLAAVEQWVKERRNSPAVVIWGLQNESTLPVEFAREATELIHRLDPLAGPKGRPVVTCNWGGGTDWNVVQNWSGTYAGYGGTLMTYDKDLAKDDQLLNGEYGAWRLVGWHSDPDAEWDIDGAWTEEHQARVFYEKLMRAWKARDRVCGQFLWTFFPHENPGRTARIEEGYRVIDKIGPVNHKGIYSAWGRRVEAWYLYYAYGKYFREGRLGEVCDRPLSWWLAEGRRMAEPERGAELSLEPIAGATYLHRMNCGGDRFVDSLGNVWMADDTRYSHSWAQDDEFNFDGYEYIPVLASQDTVDGVVKNVSSGDQGLFRTFRYGRRRLGFEFPAPAGAECTVEMYFCEPGSYGRVFDIAINGETVERGFRLADAAPDRNAVRRAWRAKATDDGRIRIDFPRVACNQAVVSAIAISTDPESAGRQAEETRKPGYPESEGYTWAELSGWVRHRTAKERLPFGGERGWGEAFRAQALPIADKDGRHRAWFGLYVAGDYTVYFKVLKGDPVGKTVHWVFQSEDFKHEIARGDFVIREVGPDGMVAMPLGKYVNAGVYTFCFSVDDDSLSMREMR